MQDEVPGTVAGPGVDPIDSLVGEGCDETFEVIRVYPDVEIQMFPSLFPDQRVDSPTPADACCDSVPLQGSNQRAHRFRRHSVFGHAPESQARQLRYRRRTHPVVPRWGITGCLVAGTFPHFGRVDDAELDVLLRNERYPRSAAYSARWMVDGGMGPNPVWQAEALTNLMPLEPGMRILDMGCGAALSSIFLAKEFGVEVWATDLWVKPDENLRRAAEAQRRRPGSPDPCRSPCPALRRGLLRRAHQHRRVPLLRHRRPLSRLLLTAS